MLSFEIPTCKQTLREGLDELNAQYADGQNLYNQLSQKAQFVLTAHDCVHVIFGCDLTYQGEALNHAWTLWGTYTDPNQRHRLIGTEAIKLALQYVNLPNAIGIFASLPLVLKVFISARQMKKRFPWLQYDTFMDTPLVDIRQQFGIKVVTRYNGVKP